MRSFILLIGVALFFTILVGCERKEKELLGRIDNYIDKDGWEELFPMNDSQDIHHYQFEKQDGDTLKVLQLIHKLKDDTVIFQLHRTFEDSTFLYQIVSNIDTLYFYKAPLDNENDRKFIMGKYYFLRNTLKLTEGQRCFFNMHIDSLRKIKGDNLPALPEINCE